MATVVAGGNLAEFMLLLLAAIVYLRVRPVLSPGAFAAFATRSPLKLKDSEGSV